MNEITVTNGVNFGKNGLEINQDISVEDWLSLGETLNTMQGAIQWWVGDWLNYGEQKYGEMYSQALSESAYSYESLANMKWVASKVKSSLRSENLSWSHHKEVAPLEEDQQRYFLELAVKEKMSRSTLRNHINANKQCDCQIKDMEEHAYVVYTCSHGKSIKQKVEDIMKSQSQNNQCK